MLVGKSGRLAWVANSHGKHVTPSNYYQLQHKQACSCDLISLRSFSFVRQKIGRRWDSAAFQLGKPLYFYSRFPVRIAHYLLVYHKSQRANSYAGANALELIALRHTTYGIVSSLDNVPQISRSVNRNGKPLRMRFSQNHHSPDKNADTTRGHVKSCLLDMLTEAREYVQVQVAAQNLHRRRTTRNKARGPHSGLG
jgi:hypothetical protein